MLQITISIGSKQGVPVLSSHLESSEECCSEVLATASKDDCVYLPGLDTTSDSGVCEIAAFEESGERYGQP